MDGILITIIVITAFLVYKMISSSRKQEGYKRWKATSSGKEEKTTKVKWEHGAWLRHALGETVPRAQYVQKFDESAVVWCANLLGVETARLKEILRDVSEHYREFWMRKRKGGYRMISAPDKELQSIQTTTFSGDVFPKEQIIPRIKQIIRDEKFEPNHKKTRFINEYGRKIITGVSVSSGAKLTIPKARKREIRKNVYFILTKGLAEHQRRIGSSDPVYLKRLTGELCYWRSIEPDNAYVSDSINRLKCLEKGY